ncbi:hypothetical protein DCCM_0684 [Desulfocucumis palustris]|uniref:DUF2232 domain-containing protein n=1 Tax=Desulfocucumis palustris TaxID=1898651 RepID=A0A2L2X8Q3_9FIRM|nr:YybS family protein [Desulfocucumis palustris]GBF32488.1 hypothetical protein DCCM_0684 [Desulfocucumis palustris]
MVPYSGNRALVEGAFFAAITVVLGLLGLYIPPLLFFTTLLMPIPLAVLVRRRDLKLGLMALAVAAALMFMLFGRPLTVLLLIIQSGPMGLLLGLLFKNRVSAGPAIAAASVVAVVTTVLTFLISFWVTGINPFDMGEEMKQSMDRALDWYTQSGLVDAAAREQFRESMEQMARLFALLLPANMVIWSLISTYITYALNRLVLIKLRYETTPLPSFSRWKFPWYVIWGGILGLGTLLLGDELKIAGMATLGKNIIYVMGFLHFILGLSVFTYFIKRWKIARGFKILIVVMVGIYWPFALSVMLTLGVMDPVMDLRRLGRDDTTKGG